MEPPLDEEPITWAVVAQAVYTPAYKFFSRRLSDAAPVERAARGDAQRPDNFQW